MGVLNCDKQKDRHCDSVGRFSKKYLLAFFGIFGTTSRNFSNLFCAPKPVINSRADDALEKAKCSALLQLVFKVLNI